MNEYILISSKKKTDESVYDQWMNRYLMSKQHKTVFDDALFCLWCYPLDRIDDILKEEYQNRYDYKQIENLHTIFNQLTKEIVIIITNRYQIILKCDRIPIGVIKTVKKFFPNVRLFCRNKDFEEVET